MKTFTLQLLIISLPLLTIACSGGGNSDSKTAYTEESGGTDSSSTSTTTSSSSNDESDLRAEDYFDLTSTYELTLDVNTGHSQRSFLSLCNGEGVETAMDVNYEDCLVRSALLRGQLNQTIKVANHLTNLVAAIWFYDGTEPILVNFSASAEQEQTFTIEL